MVTVIGFSLMPFPVILATINPLYKIVTNEQRTFILC